MYDAIQTALTVAAEAIAFITIIGLPAHYIVTSHVKKVQSSFTPQATPAPEVEPEIITPAPQPEVVQEENETVEELFQQAEEIISKPIYEEATEIIATAKAVKKPVKPRKTRIKEKPQPMSVGAAAIDYGAMTSEQLRKECALQGVAWRNGGNYGKPMKKGQMLAALRQR